MRRRSSRSRVESSPHCRARVALAATLACVLEASAEKVGNVTPTRGFADLCFADFVRSALVLGPAVGLARPGRVGWAVWKAIEASRRITASNAHLGVALLFAPIAAAALGPDRLGPHGRGGDAPAGLRSRVVRVLRGLGVDDARWAYRAIRVARPGGLGASPSLPEADVARVPNITLRQAMALAAERDSIATEYAHDFVLTFTIVLPALRRAMNRELGPLEAITQAHLELLAAVPDTLIARKAGPALAEAVSARARRVVALGGCYTRNGRSAAARLDRRLRRDGNRLNPGTSADLMAAALFVSLLLGR